MDQETSLLLALFAACATAIGAALGATISALAQGRYARFQVDARDRERREERLSELFDLLDDDSYSIVLMLRKLSAGQKCEPHCPMAGRELSKVRRLMKRDIPALEPHILEMQKASRNAHALLVEAQDVSQESGENVSIQDPGSFVEALREEAKRQADQFSELRKQMHAMILSAMDEPSK